jgi:hypothetical protein
VKLTGVGRAVGFGVGSTVGAGEATGGSDGSTGPGELGSVGTDGAGDTGAGDAGGADTDGWLGAGVAGLHAARTSTAISEAAYTSLDMGRYLQVRRSSSRRYPFDARPPRFVADKRR